MKTAILLACLVASVWCQEATQRPCEDAFPDCKQRVESENICQHFIDAVAYCPRTCGKCSGPTPAVVECHDFDHLCPALSNSEYCTRDIARHLCPKSCGLCPTTTAEPTTTSLGYIVVTDPNCQDIDPDCIVLLQRHYCSERPVVVNLCRRSCNACPNITVPITPTPTGPVVEVPTTAAPPGVCEDHDVECSTMTCNDPLDVELCPKTCGRCPEELTTEVVTPTQEEVTPTQEEVTPTTELITPEVTTEVTTTPLPTTAPALPSFASFITPEYCVDNDKDCALLEQTHNCQTDQLFFRLCPVTCKKCIPSTTTPVANVTELDCRDYIMDCDKLKPSCSFDDLVVRLCHETCNAPPCPPEIVTTPAVVTTEAPAVTSEAPVIVTETSVVTEAPVTTEAPVVPTEVSGGLNNTPAFETTEAQVTTPAPETTEAPVTTLAPETTETPSLVTVEVPVVVTTETPVETTEAPADTTPAVSTEAPATTPEQEGETTTTEAPATTEVLATTPTPIANTNVPIPVITLATGPKLCFDTEPDCPNLVQTFFCATNELIRRICPESCGICYEGTTPTPLECRDLDAQCPNLRDFCDRPELLVNRLCRKTCGYCGVEITVPPKIPDPFPLTCRVCVDPFCNQEVESVVTCPEDRPYCATRVVNNADGTRGLTKSCSDEPDCDRGYLGRAAGNETCFNFNPAVITQEAFICFFCCVNNECNRHARPDQITLYATNTSFITES